MRRMVPTQSRELIALGIRQPWAELILRGAKTIEVRTVGTRVRGPILVYAAKKLAGTSAAREAAAHHGLDVHTLPRGVLVGTVELRDTRPCRDSDVDAACLPPAELQNRVGWMLASPCRFATPQEPRFLPYGIWFYPFRRKRQPSPD